MFSTSTIDPYQNQSTSRPSGGRTNSVAEEQEPGKKPKKANSEIRKQQNRIASRNYREKRKRKLQYLQQLLREGESPEQAAKTVEEADRKRTVTPEYSTQQPPAPSSTLQPNASYPPLSSTSRNAIDPVFSTSTPHYDRQLGRTSHAYDTYAAYENAWNTSMYDTSANVNCYTWTVPTWMPSIDYTPSGSSRPEVFHYTPSSNTHQTFEQLPTPPQQPRTPDPNFFIPGSYDHYRRMDGQQMMGVSNVSLPSSASSSPFHYARFGGMP